MGQGPMACPAAGTVLEPEGRGQSLQLAPSTGSVGQGPFPGLLHQRLCTKGKSSFQYFPCFSLVKTGEGLGFQTYFRPHPHAWVSLKSPPEEPLSVDLTLTHSTRQSMDLCNQLT